MLKPPPGKVFFGVTDTGEASDFRDFSRAVGKHPPIIQTFHQWGNSWSKSMPRWRSIKARPMLHMTTRADNGEELITPRQIISSTPVDTRSRCSMCRVCCSVLAGKMK